MFKYESDPKIYIPNNLDYIPILDSGQYINIKDPN